MNNKVTLERDGKTVIIVVRDTDTPKIGRKFHWGSGRCWLVVAIQPIERMAA